MEDYRRRQQERWQKENSRGSSEPLGVSISPNNIATRDTDSHSPVTSSGRNHESPIIIDDSHLNEETIRPNRPVVATVHPPPRQPIQTISSTGSKSSTNAESKRKSLPQQPSSSSSTQIASPSNNVFGNLYNTVKNFFQQKPKPNQQNTHNEYQTVSGEDDDDVVMHEASSSTQQSNSSANHQQVKSDEELARQLQEEFDKEAEEERERYQRYQEHQQQQQQQRQQQQQQQQQQRPRRNRSFFELFNEDDPFENFDRLMRDMQRRPQYHPFHHDTEDEPSSFLEELISLPRPRQRIPVERLFGPHPMTLQQLQSQFGGNFIISYPDSMGYLDPSSMTYDELLRLQERIGHVNTGINQNQIEANTSTYKIDKDLEEQCNICLEKFKKDDSVRRLPCLHLYHSDCIDNWLKQNKTCPTCRKDVTQADETQS